MALEYILSFDSEFQLLNEIEAYFVSKNLSNNFEDGSYIDIGDSQGFNLRFYHEDFAYFEIVRDDQIEELEFVKSSNLLIRLIKDFDNVSAKSNMIGLVSYLMKLHSENCVLIFISGGLVLERKNGQLFFNNSFGFWNFLSPDEFFLK
jgi:hypothetical protein